MLVPLLNLVCDPARDDDVHVPAAAEATGTLMLTGEGFLLPPLAVQLHLPIRIAFPAQRRDWQGLYLKRLPQRLMLNQDLNPVHITALSGCREAKHDLSTLVPGSASSFCRIYQM